MMIISMRTTLSFTLSSSQVKKTRKLARARGFSTVSDYIRFLLEEDDVSLINEDELVKRANEVERLHRTKKLVTAKSMADFME